MSINVIKQKEGFSVKGEFVGCEFNFEIHPMGNDIKAITYHDFYVKETSEGWEAYVLIDI
ncbi:MAG: archease [Candidatus Heimdallarchaeota archaeon]|nr:archease [Candidatus Heimdallarchaeota archaeon]